MDRSCESRVEAALAARLSELRLLYDGATATDLELVDDGTLDTVVHVGVHEFRYGHEEAAEYRDDDGALDLEALFNDRRSDFEEALSEERSEYGLAFDYVAPGTFREQEEGYLRYQLSWGGPSDEFRFFVNPDLSVHRIEYWFLDWYDGAHRVLEGDDKALLARVFEEFKEIGVVEAQVRGGE